jgi:peptidoglycan hydrolase-like protein with peptidoglycan-binding domain
VAALLRGDAVGSISPSPRLASAQRALGKLGFEVKADGVAGPATRQAIEAFERRQGLPVTGELNARTIRKLAIASSTPID